MSTEALKVTYRATASLSANPRNSRTHTKKQIRQVADSIAEFGFTNPVLISSSGEIVAGHCRVAAAKLLKLKKVPTIELGHLTDVQRRALVIADNRLALNAGWDAEMLALEFRDLMDLGADVTLTGFSLGEIDLILDNEAESNPAAERGSKEDEIPGPEGPAITQRGDIWKLGRHRLICGDAREPADYSALLQNEAADLIFTDPPFNCPIDGHVSGLGKVRHREFAMASGEMSDAEFVEFLRTSLGSAAAECKDGTIAFVCMDWRGIWSLLEAGRSVFTEHKQICVWNKTNGGMGTFYRSKHELVAVFKVGTEPHTNTFGLGDTGRYRTNVWDYAGVNSFGSARDEERKNHPTVKPVALVADAIRDCSKRGEIVLDPFAGSGTTLIAAEKCGRCARLIEYDPLYCDTIVRRYERVTGKQAVLEATGDCFEDVATTRLSTKGSAA